MLLSAIAAAACNSSGNARPISEPLPLAERDALAPESVLEELKSGNRRFVAGRELARDWKSLVEKTAEGAHPIAAVLTTTDSRVVLPQVFDLGVGDVTTVRTLGGVPTDAAVAALERAVTESGAKEILVLVHGDCSELYAAYAGAVSTIPAPGPALLIEAKRAIGPDIPVSYTHLTLPTIYSV